jgi:hypothetical protein
MKKMFKHLDEHFPVVHLGYSNPKTKKCHNKLILKRYNIIKRTGTIIVINDGPESNDYRYCSRMTN